MVVDIHAQSRSVAWLGKCPLCRIFDCLQLRSALCSCAGRRGYVRQLVELGSAGWDVDVKNL
jgi:hypothetical protein